MLEKGNKFVGQYQRLMKPSRGTTAKHMCQHYIAVAIPRMLYAADIFLTPGSARYKGTKGHIRKLGRIQRQATLTITGAMKTTANDTLDVHANLLPLHLLISKIIHRAATCLACLPDNHPLSKHVLKASKKYVKKHRTPLHEIIHTYRLKLKEMEKIETTVMGPKWQPSFNICIPAQEEQAIKESEMDLSDIRIFSDGSCIERGTCQHCSSPIQKWGRTGMCQTLHGH